MTGASSKTLLDNAIKMWRLKAEREPDSLVAKKLDHAEKVYSEALEHDEGWQELQAMNLAHTYNTLHGSLKDELGI